MQNWCREHAIMFMTNKSAKMMPELPAVTLQGVIILSDIIYLASVSSIIPVPNIIV